MESHLHERNIGVSSGWGCSSFVDVTKNYRTLFFKSLKFWRRQSRNYWKTGKKCGSASACGIFHYILPVTYVPLLLNLKTLLKVISHYEIYILGDFNIDLMKYSEHLLAEQYLTMLYSNNLLPLTTKPTRLTQHTSTLIDHIYTNSYLRVDASVLCTWSANINI